MLTDAASNNYTSPKQRRRSRSGLGDRVRSRSRAGREKKKGCFLKALSSVCLCLIKISRNSSARSNYFKKVINKFSAGTRTLRETRKEVKTLLDFLYTGSLPKEKLEKHSRTLYRAGQKYEIGYLMELASRPSSPVSSFQCRLHPNDADINIDQCFFYGLQKGVRNGSVARLGTAAGCLRGGVGRLNAVGRSMG
ncbi:hypothetical protein WN943_018506 [Citrus x changshan-huyou]